MFDSLIADKILIGILILSVAVLFLKGVKLIFRLLLWTAALFFLWFWFKLKTGN